ncbi:MAG: cell division ATP-binding protein FtsE [Bacilli bacterium]|nr:cell division ATP-binding protein FtsE [Bacilli bacterium]
MSFIEFKDCYKTYSNGVTALANVSLTIGKGEFVFLIGSSGSGKSTLTKMLYREEKPTKGKVMVGGINVAKLRNGQVFKLRRKLGIVFQDFKLLPKLTVYENVAYGLETQGLKKKEIKPKVLKALERVGLKERIRSFPHQLSGGEQQRVCIARAIVNKPKLLICDEPTGNLDPKTSKEIVSVLDNINKEMKTTIIMATHDKEIVNTMKKRVVIIENGGIAGDYDQGSYKDFATRKIDLEKLSEEKKIVKKTEKLIEEKKIIDKQIQEDTKPVEIEKIEKKAPRRTKKEDL